MRTLRGILAVAIAAVCATAAVQTPAAAAASNARGTYFPVTPQRILDTRTGNGAPAGQLGANQTVSLQVAGRGGVPATGVAAVVLNVTVTEHTNAGHVTVYPSGVAKPTASSLNYSWFIKTVANSVTVGVGADGKVNLAATYGTPHLIADVMGYFASGAEGQTVGGTLFTIPAKRVFDSREFYGHRVHAGGFGALRFNFSADINPHVTAVVLNITAADAAGPGHIGTWNGHPSLEDLPPKTSTLNFQAGQTVANMTIVPVGPCLSPCSHLPGGDQFRQTGYYTNQETHVIVDLVGYIAGPAMTGGLRFEPMTPTRIVDTRIGQGIPGAIGQQTTATVTTPGSVADATTNALSLNVTGVNPDWDTHLIVWGNGTSKPGVSNLNPSWREIVPNAVITGLDPDKKFNVYNNTGNIHVVVDVVGTWYATA